MVLLPVTNPLGVFLIPEVVLVLWFGQPSSLRLALARFTALGLQAIALALSIPIIRKKKFLTVKAFASGLRRLHRVPNQGATSIGNRKNQAEENPPGRKLKPMKKEEDFSANARRKCQGRRSNSRPAVLIQFYFTADKFGARLAFGSRGIQESVFEIPQPMMEAQQSGGAENDGRPEEPARIEERRTEPEKQTIGGPETRSSPTVLLQDQELVLEE